MQSRFLKHSYDTVAFFYDRFARLIFGRAQVNAQLYLLAAIPAGSRILIVGGGTGWILEEITKIYPSGLSITYIDASEIMVAKARKRNAGSNTVSFIAAPIQDVVLDGGYDVVFTAFLFDNITTGDAWEIGARIYDHIVPGGLWLDCDFARTNVSWHKALLKTMYLFFRLMCNIDASSLPDMETCFSPERYTLAQSKTFFRDFISARIYTKR